MPEVRGLTIAVGPWYARTLEICLAQNMRHFTECLVATAPGDEAVKSVVEKVPGARVFETDAFTRPDLNGVVPAFNKGLAMNEALQALGLAGWIWIWDSDCLFPPHVPFERLRFGCIHGCMRRILEDPARWRPNLDWTACPRARDGGPVGFTQIFHADDPVLHGRKQLYDVSFPHAGGGDHAFMCHWHRQKYITLPFDVLHLGRPDSHWFGTDQEGRDMMARFVYRNGWKRGMENYTTEDAARGKPEPPRLSYEGYERTPFEIPFVRRREEEGR